MDLEGVFEQAGIPLLVFVVCAYYGFRLIVLQDVACIRGKDKPPVKNEKEYAKHGGMLILFLAAATLGMAFLLFVSVKIAFAEVCVCVIIFGLLWKKMEENYGAR